MAEIVVYGTPSRLQKKEIADAAAFFCNLLLKRLSKNIYIEIYFIANFYKNTKCLGEMEYTDFDSYKPRDFKITLDCNLAKKTMIKTLAHEIVHVKQYARGELKDLKRTKCKKWQGLVYEESMNYFEQPWEKSATESEQYLYNQWINEKRAGNNDKKTAGTRVIRTGTLKE